MKSPPVSLVPWLSWRDCCSTAVYERLQMRSTARSRGSCGSTVVPWEPKMMLAARTVLCELGRKGCESRRGSGMRPSCAVSGLNATSGRCRNENFACEISDRRLLVTFWLGSQDWNSDGRGTGSCFFRSLFEEVRESEDVQAERALQPARAAAGRVCPPSGIRPGAPFRRCRPWRRPKHQQRM